MRQMHRGSIADMGIPAALYQMLLPAFCTGRLARIMQPGVLDGSIPSPDTKSGGRFTAAISAADVDGEDCSGLFLNAMFDDVSFYGEERDLDHVSSRFKPDQPFRITLDPVNGTLYYKTGVPQWDVIMTICRGTEILGAIDYHPNTEHFFIGIKDAGAFTITEEDFLAGRDWSPFRVRTRVRAIQINFSDDRVSERLRAKGYTVVSSREEFKEGDASWTYATHGILTGALCGLLKRDFGLIDSGAIALIAKEAGAAVSTITYNPETLHGDSVIVGTTPEIYADITAALAP